MPSYSAPRCRHIMVSGTQCGSPALRNNYFCFYHQHHRPLTFKSHIGDPRLAAEITIPPFEDAHSIQSVLRQVMIMILQDKIASKTAGLLLYSLQIASSNLKRMQLEIPQPAQVVTDLADDSGTSIAALDDVLPEPESQEVTVSFAERKSLVPDWADFRAQRSEVVAQMKAAKIAKMNSAAIPPSSANNNDNNNSNNDNNNNESDLPPGTIQACYRPAPHRPERRPQ